MRHIFLKPENTQVKSSTLIFFGSDKKVIPSASWRMESLHKIGYIILTQAEVAQG